MGIIVCILIFIGFGASVAAIYDEHQKLTKGSNNCPQFPANLTSFTLEKQLSSQWHWTYGISEFSGSVQLLCPTTQYDTGLWLDGSFAAYVDGKILTTVSRSNINDCHGNRLYVTESGSSFQTLINGNNMFVSYVLRDVNVDVTLAYVSGTHLFEDTINIQAIDGITVASMTRNLISLRWMWDISIYDIKHPGADPIVLALLAGKRSFYDSHDSNGNHKGDMCNSYFWPVAWIMVAFVSFVGVIILIVSSCVIYEKLKGCRIPCP